MTTRTETRRQLRDEQGRFTERDNSRYRSRGNYSRYGEDEDEYRDDEDEDEDRGSSARYWAHSDADDQDRDYYRNDYGLNHNRGRDYENGTGDRDYNGYSSRNSYSNSYSHPGYNSYSSREGYNSGYGSQRGGRYSDNDDYSYGNYSSGRNYSGGESSQRNGRYNDNEGYGGRHSSYHYGRSNDSGHGRQGFASMDRDRVRDIARMGGEASHRNDRGHFGRSGSHRQQDRRRY